MTTLLEKMPDLQDKYRNAVKDAVFEMKIADVSDYRLIILDNKTDNKIVYKKN